MNADRTAFRTDEFRTPRMIPIMGLPNVMSTISQCQIDNEPISPSPTKSLAVMLTPTPDDDG